MNVVGKSEIGSEGLGLGVGGGAYLSRELSGRDICDGIIGFALGLGKGAWGGSRFLRLGMSWVVDG